MDRNRETRRVNTAAANGLSRRRHRTTSLRDSPDVDGGGMELQETTRLRDRGVHGKKDKDRDRERERDRDRLSSRSRKRRERLLLHGDDSSEGSVNDEDEDEEFGGGPSSSTRMVPQAANTSSFSSSTFPGHHHHNSNLQSQRKSFPPPARFMKAAAATVTETSVSFVATTWKPAAVDEMIGVPVPRKARTACTKRAHDWASTSGVGSTVTGGELLHRQASTSPRESPASMMASPSRAASPSSSSASKKMKPSGPKQRPPKMSSKAASSSLVQDEIEIEIAEVLSEMKMQSENDATAPNNNNNNTGVQNQSKVSSPISLHHRSSVAVATSTSNTTFSVTVPKRKKPRIIKYEEDSNSVYPANHSSFSSNTKTEIDPPTKPTKLQAFSPKTEKKNSDDPAEKDIIISLPENPDPKLKSEKNPASDSFMSKEETQTQTNEIIVTGDDSESKRLQSGLRLGHHDYDHDNSTITKGNSTVKDSEVKFQIDLMAPPYSSLSPERESNVDCVAINPKPLVTAKEMEQTDKELKKVLSTDEQEKIGKVTPEKEAVSEKPAAAIIDLQESSDSGNKINHHHAQKQHLPNTTEKNARSGSLSLPMSMANWPGAHPSMGYMAAPLPGVVAMDGSSLSSGAVQTPSHVLFNQPRPKRCATHSYIARNISYHQQFLKMNPFWPAPPGATPVYGAKPNTIPSLELQGNITNRGVNFVQDKAHGHNGKDKSPQASSSVERKPTLHQQPQAPAGANNILHGPGPAFIFPMNQPQQHSAAVGPGSVKSPLPTGNSVLPAAANSASVSNVTLTQSGPAPGMAFNYPNMQGNEPQYLAILQNNAYPYPVGSQPGYRPPTQLPYFYSPQMLHHPSQIQQQLAVSQKHLQSQQPRPGMNNVTLQGFPTQKLPSSQPMPMIQNEDSPSNGDSRMNMYSQRKPGSRASAEPQAFAMSFSSGSSTPGLDMSSMAQNQAVLQNMPESQRQGYQMMAAAVAAQAAQQKKNYRSPEDGKLESSNCEEERKKQLPGQSIAFSRPDLTEAGSTTSVIDSSAQALLGSRTHNSVIAHQRNHQQQQMLQKFQQHKLQQQQLEARNKTASTSYSTDQHIPSSSTVAVRFTNPPIVPAFAQNFVQSSQWKNSVRTTTSASQVPTSSIKNIPQQHIPQQRPQQQQQTQISFSANPKLMSNPQAQQAASTTSQSASPSASSMSRNVSGSPRTNATNKVGLSQAASSPLSPLPNNKSSAGAPSGIGNPHFAPNIATKSQLSKQQQQQQQLHQQQLHQQLHQQQPKHALQQAQLFFSGAYMQNSAGALQQHQTNMNQGSNGFYLQRQRNEQPPLNSSVTIVNNTATSDPAKAIAAATASKS